MGLSKYAIGRPCRHPTDRLLTGKTRQKTMSENRTPSDGDDPNRPCDVPENLMRPSDEAEVDGFLSWVKHSKGEEVAERWLGFYHDSQFANESMMQLLV